MRAFLNRVFNTARTVGHRVNRTFNAIKTHTRAAIPFVKRVAHSVRDAARNYSSLPGVGVVASQVGAVADAVHRGTSVVEHGLNAAEQFQRSVGLNT